MVLALRADEPIPAFHGSQTLMFTLVQTGVKQTMATWLQSGPSRAMQGLMQKNNELVQKKVGRPTLWCKIYTYVCTCCPQSRFQDCFLVKMLHLACRRMPSLETQVTLLMGSCVLQVAGL